MKEHPWEFHFLWCWGGCMSTLSSVLVMIIHKRVATMHVCNTLMQVYYNPSRFNWEWNWRSCKGLKWDLHYISGLEFFWCCLHRWVRVVACLLVNAHRRAHCWNTATVNRKIFIIWNFCWKHFCVENFFVGSTSYKNILTQKFLPHKHLYVTIIV